MNGPGEPPLPDRLARLARVTSELIRADTADSVAKTVVTHGAEAVGATVATMTLLDPDGLTVRLVALSGGRDGDEEEWGSFPSPRTPLQPRSSGPANA